MPEQPKERQIDWTNPNDKVSQYFTVKEAIYLRSWGRLANETDGLTPQVKIRLIDMFLKMDLVREFVGKAINVHVAFRPEEYNKQIGGAKNSAHKCEGPWAAVDWSCDFNSDGKRTGQDCDLIREALKPKLAEWNLRMEDNGLGATWIHLDSKEVPPGGNRYFKP